MKMKFGLLSIFLQSLICLKAAFLALTQFPSIRQPTKLFILLILLWSSLSLTITVYNYVKEDKD